MVWGCDAYGPVRVRPITVKRCANCGVLKDPSSFRGDPTVRSGLKAWCRDCDRARNREYERAKAAVRHAGKIIKCDQCWEVLPPAPGRKYTDRLCKGCAPSEKWRALVRRYGVDKQMYEAMYFDQDGECLIPSCTREAKSVDHDHRTGSVRGLVCQGCNVALGFLEDAAWVEGALQYLRGELV